MICIYASKSKLLISEVVKEEKNAYLQAKKYLKYFKNIKYLRCVYYQ